MRERIARLVGPRARAIWASTFHSACVRILRRDAESAGYARDFSIYDADDQLRLIRRVPDRGRGRPEAGRAAGRAGADLGRQEPAPGPRRRWRRDRLLQRRDRGARLPALRRRAARQRGDGLRRPPDGHRPAPGGRRGRARRAGSRASSTCWWTSTRTPTTPSTAWCARWASRSATSWRSATTTRASTRGAAPTCATSSTSSATTPTPRWSPWSRTTAPPGPSCGRPTRWSRATRTATPSASGPSWATASRSCVVACRDEHEEARVVADADRRRAGPRASLVGDRRLLPHQRAEPRDRGPAGAPPGALRRGGRPALLRAGRGARPARLPARRRQPGRRGEHGPHARGAQARPGPRGASASSRPSPPPTGSRWSTPCGHAEVVPGLPARASAPRVAEAGALVADARVMVEAGSPLDQVLEDGARALRPAGRAGPRGHLRGAGPGREPGGDGAGGGRVRGRPRTTRRWPASWRGSRSRPTPTWSTPTPARSPS